MGEGQEQSFEWPNGTLKQTIYHHGGSHIFLERKDCDRKLIADTYGEGGEEYARSIFRFTEEWLKNNGQI